MGKLSHVASIVAGRGLRSRRALGALVAAVGITGTAAVAGAAQPGAPFTVSPSEGAPFTVVDVSGAGCTAGPAPTVIGTVVGSPEVGTITQFTATPDAAGDWATTFTVPPNKPAGPYEVTATCKTDPGQIDGLPYVNQPFTVLAGEAATLTVSPRSATAGTDVVVSVSGTLCRGEGATVDVGIFRRVPEEFAEADEFVARTTATPDAAGNWSSELTIPASSGAGTFGVGAQCFVGGAQFFLYPTVDVVLSAAAAPAAPVTRQPSFTG
jgi:hypothetical protein